MKLSTKIRAAGNRGWRWSIVDGLGVEHESGHKRTWKEAFEAGRARRMALKADHFFAEDMRARLDRWLKKRGISVEPLFPAGGEALAVADAAWEARDEA